VTRAAELNALCPPVSCSGPLCGSTVPPNGLACGFMVFLDDDGAYVYGCIGYVRLFSGEWACSGGVSGASGSLPAGCTVIPGSGSNGSNPGQNLGSGGPSMNRTGTIAEPINTLTGNFYSAQTDLAIHGRGLPFVFNRYYNSLDPTTGPLGIGWTHSYNLSLTVNSTNAVVSVRQQDGSVVAFQPTSGGAFNPVTRGLFDTLTQNADGSYLLRRHNQTVLRFSATGVLQSVTDRNGNTQILAYSTAGDLASIRDTVGRIITFTVNASHQIISMTDPLSRTVYATRVS
jgi:YD repeat-containing protein